MTQADKTEAIINGMDGMTRFHQVFTLSAHARDLARKLDAVKCACNNCGDSDDERFGLGGLICDILDADQ